MVLTVLLKIFAKLRSLVGKGGGPEADPDEKWSNLHREREKNKLYSWAATELMQAYDTSGEDGVLEFAHSKLVPLLYNDGERVEKISFSDYTKWKMTQNTNLGEAGTQVALVNEENYVPHCAQWRLNKRGIDGETLVHLLFNRPDPRARELGKILMKEIPGLALDIYEGDELYGQSLLHLAIVHNDYDAVIFLLELGASVTSRARGRFFWPEDQKGPKPEKNTNYVGNTYFGEYPLAFAATFGNKDIYDALLEYGGDPNLQDTYGNTVLHICVINNSIEMYSYAVRHFAKSANVDIKNAQSLTPLALATKLGRKEIVDEMLELTKEEFWRYSNIACSAYPLTALDTIRADGSRNAGSALQTILDGNTTSHLDMAGSEIVQRLILDKWKAFGRGKLYERLIFLMVHVCIIMIAVYLRPMELGSSLLQLPATCDTDCQSNTITRFVAECLACLFSTVYLVYYQGAEIYSQGFKEYAKNLVAAETKIFYIIANVFILLCIPCRFIDTFYAPYVENILLVIACPCAWLFFLFFLKSFLLIGPFVQMIYRMLSGDMLRFLILFFLFIISFSQIFYFYGKDVAHYYDNGWCSSMPGTFLSGNSTELNAKVDFENFFQTMETVFRAGVGPYDWEDFDCDHLDLMAKMIYVLYLVCVPIMLINMLIATMGNTYINVISQAEKAWRRSWAQIVIVMERTLSPQKLAEHQRDYSIKLADAKDDGLEIRGLMVIKRTAKTKPMQRKQATVHWKTLGRKVIQQLSKESTEQTRFRLHNSHRASTPVLLDSLKQEMYTQGYKLPANR